MTFRTRFAPSPTGPLHLGHAYSALLAYDMAMAEGGEFILRIEDIDQTRARPEWEAQILDDLSWLGLHWEVPVLRQTERMAAYDKVLASLWSDEAAFACTCTRRDVLAAASAPNEGEALMGPDGIVYPGTCRDRRSDHGRLSAPPDAALRLDMARVAKDTPSVLSFREDGLGPSGENGTIEFNVADLVYQIGDVVLARRDIGTSYHLSVVLDDAYQNITHVIRGEDLFEATKIHVVLQHLLGLPTPVYHHHPLIRGEDGKRLAKRDKAKAIQRFRDDGATPNDIRRIVGL